MINQNFYLEIINELEIKSKNLNLRAFSGYGSGHPWTPRKRIGYGIIDPTEELKSDEAPSKVKISKAFKKEDKNDLH